MSTTGKAGLYSRTLLRVWMPSILAMRTSVSTASKARSRTRFRASSPSAASLTA